MQSIAAVTDNAVNPFPTPVVISTQWDVNPGQTNSISLVAYFTTPSQALVGGAVQIPSSRVLGRMSTGLPTTFTPFTQAAVAGAGSAGGSLTLFSENISGPNKGALTRTDNLDLQLNLVGFPDLPVGTYTGRSGNPNQIELQLQIVGPLDAAALLVRAADVPMPMSTSFRLPPAAPAPAMAAWVNGVNVVGRPVLMRPSMRLDGDLHGQRPISACARGREIAR